MRFLTKEEKVLYKQILTVSVLLGVGLQAQAQTYPAKTVRIVIPFAAGGNTDFTGRSIAAKLSETLGQQFVVDNRPGGYTNIGAEIVIKTPPDGYNILLTSAAIAVNVAVMNKMPFDPLRDLAPVILVVKGANVLVVHPSLPAKNLQELIALAKARPGQLNYGTSGVASSNHMAGELLVHMAGIKINHVPYKGNAPAITDLLGGHIEMNISGVPVLVPHIKSGRMRAIGIGSLKRFAAIPEVPTFHEQGLKGYEASTWFAMFVPAKTPRDIILKINSEVGKVLASKEIRDRYQVEGLEPQGGSPEDLGKFLRSEIDLYTKLAKAANLPKL
jgi:tripartite-type tricarboxylate transporter receptor subunit TctC